MTLSSPRQYLTTRRVLSFWSISLPSLSRTAPQATRSRSSSTSLLPCDSFGRSRGRLSCFVSHPLRVRHRAQRCCEDRRLHGRGTAIRQNCRAAAAKPPLRPSGRTLRAGVPCWLIVQGRDCIRKPAHEAGACRARSRTCRPGRLSDRLPRRHFSHRRGDAGRSIGKRSSAPWQPPLGTRKVAAIASGVPLQVVLVLWLGLPEPLLRVDFRNDWARPTA